MNKDSTEYYNSFMVTEDDKMNIWKNIAGDEFHLNLEQIERLPSLYQMYKNKVIEFTYKKRELRNTELRKNKSTFKITVDVPQYDTRRVWEFMHANGYTLSPVSDTYHLYTQI